MTYTSQEIEDDEYVDEFVNSMPIKESTIKNYVLHIKNYANYLEKSPTDIILEAEQEESEGIKSRKRKIKKYLNGFVRQMKKEEYSPLTIERTIGSVKSFYYYFDITTPKMRLEIAPASTVKDLPTKEEIKKVIHSASLRDKAIVLLQFSSGLSANEVRNLKVVDFLEALDLPKNTPINMIRNNIRDTTVPGFTIQRRKVNLYEYLTFCSVEARESIIYYLEGRKDESPWLFTNGEGGQIKKRTFMAIYERLCDRNDLGVKRNGRSRRFSSHSLRRAFASNMFGANIPKSHVDFFLGHSSDKISNAYYKVRKDEIKEVYIEGMNSVSIDKVNVINFESEEVRDMRQEMADLKKQMEYQKKEIELQKKVIKQIDQLSEK